MSAAEIDAYPDQLEEPKRSTWSQLRRDILAVIPDAEQCKPPRGLGRSATGGGCRHP